MKFSSALLLLLGGECTYACLHHHGPFDFKIDDVASHAALNARTPTDRERQFLAVPSNTSARKSLEYVFLVLRCWSLTYSLPLR